MKSLYESLLTGNVRKPSAKFTPHSRDELKQFVDQYIAEIKPRPGQEVDLNWIDISGVDDLNELFMSTNYIPVIDAWKIDHVKDFSYMFADNEYIAHSPIPVLQKKLLMDCCYLRMFEDCSALETAPQLPAKKLTKSCYVSMFENCKKLKVAPKLPAKVLTENCYECMFEGCAALEVAPALPATHLDVGCYESMFTFCEKLKVAPELPAKNLEMCCYWKMFADCKSLEYPPDLPATELIQSCYSYMFSGCTSLKRRANMPDNVDPHDMACFAMYGSIDESLLTGKVSKPSAKVQPGSKKELQQIVAEYIEEIKPRPGQEVDFNWIDISGVDDLSSVFAHTNYIPVIDKWKIDHVKDFSYMFTANRYIKRSPIPVLQEKLLQDKCYCLMFERCTALEEPPELPAKQLTVGCYAFMFDSCSSLKRAPQLPAENMVDECYRGMFWDCVSLQVPPELPATQLAKNCYNGIFWNCRNLRSKAKTPSANSESAEYAKHAYVGCDKIKE